MLNSALGILANRIILQTKKNMDLWAAAMFGLVVCGVLASLLSIAIDTLFSTMVGALVGGGIAAYVLYSKIGRAAAAGALSGLLGFPLFLGVSEILLIFGLIPIPSGPSPNPTDLQGPVVVYMVISLVFGAVGGLLAGAVHQPKAEIVPIPAVTQSGVAQVRYCVQCGAQLPGGTLICPHCNVRQPQ